MKFNFIKLFLIFPIFLCLSLLFSIGNIDKTVAAEKKEEKKEEGKKEGEKKKEEGKKEGKEKKEGEVAEGEEEVYVNPDLKITGEVIEIKRNAEFVETGEKKYTETEYREGVNKAVAEKMEFWKNNSYSELTKDVLAKEKVLKEKGEKLAKLEEQLKINEAELLKKTLEFNAVKDKIIACLKENEEDEKNRINHIVEIISTMRPQKAADMLAIQEADVSVRVLAQLDSAKASKIFNLMDKEISARIQKQYLDMKK